MLLSRSTPESFTPYSALEHTHHGPQAAPRVCSRTKQINNLPGTAVNENGVSQHRLHLALC